MKSVKSAGGGRGRAVEAVRDAEQRGKDEGAAGGAVPEGKRVSADRRADEPSGSARARAGQPVPEREEGVHPGFA